MGEFGEAAEVLGGLFLDVLRDLWETAGGWPFFGPFLLVASGIVVVLLNEGGGSGARKGKRK